MTIPNPQIKKLFEQVFETYNENLKKSFGWPRNRWPQSPILLSKVDKETAKELLNLMENLPNIEVGEFYTQFGFAYILSKRVKEEEITDNLASIYQIRDEGGDRYLTELSQVIGELKVIAERERERERERESKILRTVPNANRTKGVVSQELKTEMFVPIVSIPTF
jgi:hypothetical protein